MKHVLLYNPSTTTVVSKLPSTPKQDVVLIARDTWHDYLGYTLESSCDLELVGWSVADCKSYAETNSSARKGTFERGRWKAGGELEIYMVSWRYILVTFYI